MKGYRLLLLNDLVPAAQAMCSALAAPGSVASEKAAWDRPEHCLFQVDLPGVQARVVEEVARMRKVSPETLLLEWVSRCRTELAAFGADGPAGGLLRRCRLLAQWEELGYKGNEAAIGELVRRFVRE